MQGTAANLLEPNKSHSSGKVIAKDSFQGPCLCQLPHSTWGLPNQLLFPARKRLVKVSWGLREFSTVLSEWTGLFIPVTKLSCKLGTCNSVHDYELVFLCIKISWFVHQMGWVSLSVSSVSLQRHPFKSQQHPPSSCVPTLSFLDFTFHCMISVASYSQKWGESRRE